jgi:hypothetical protein
MFRKVNARENRILRRLSKSLVRQRLRAARNCGFAGTPFA